MSAIASHLEKYGTRSKRHPAWAAVLITAGCVGIAAVFSGVVVVARDRASSSPLAANVAHSLPSLGVPLASHTMGDLRIDVLSVRRATAKFPGALGIPGEEYPASVVRLRITNTGTDVPIEAFAEMTNHWKLRSASDDLGNTYQMIGVFGRLGQDAPVWAMPGEPLDVELAYAPFVQAASDITIQVWPGWFRQAGGPVPLTFPAP